MRYPPPVHKPYQCPVCSKGFTETGAKLHHAQTLKAVETFKKEFAWLKRAIKEGTQFVLSTPGICCVQDRRLTAFKFEQHIKPCQNETWCAGSRELRYLHTVEADIRIITARYGSVARSTFSLPCLTRVDEKVFELDYELAHWSVKGKQSISLWNAERYSPTIPDGFPMTRAEIASYYNKLTGNKMKGA